MYDIVWHKDVADRLTATPALADDADATLGAGSVAVAATLHVSSAAYASTACAVAASRHTVTQISCWPQLAVSSQQGCWRSISMIFAANAPPDFMKARP